MKETCMAKEPVLLRQVLECFIRYPQRQDTLQGIAQWWLLENRIDWAVTEVQAALDELVARKWVATRRTAEGKTLYRMNDMARDDIAALLEPGRPKDT